MTMFWVWIVIIVLVIVGAWLTTWVYVRWANSQLDPRRAAIRDASRR